MGQAATSEQEQEEKTAVAEPFSDYDVTYLLKCAQEERVRGQEYIMSRQGCVESILNDMEAVEVVKELAEQENDSMAKDTFLSQAAFCHSEASANMKNIFDIIK